MRCFEKDMNQNFLLSLFPGIGLLDLAFEREGFCVVRATDKFFGGEIKNFHAPVGKFDGIIGGPPCKRYSSLRHIIQHNGHRLAEDLIPEYERVVCEGQPFWFLMENVKDAPLPNVPGYKVHSFLLNNRWLGEEQNRVRGGAVGTRTPPGDFKQMS
jgi:DNA (cytosine-5)-methyltransferase 1